MKKKTKVQKTTQEKKEGEYTEREKAYADTACGCFTTLRKWAAFAAASSRLVIAAEQARCDRMLLPAAPSRRRGGGTRAVARRRLAARDDFSLVIIWPVVEADSKPGAACFAAGFASSRLCVVVHGGRPQVVVLQVMLCPVGEKSAIRPRPGRRSKERALPRCAGWSESAKKNSATKLREEREK